MASSAQPEDDKEFSTWMESANQLNGKLGYFLKEKDGPESAKAAQEMQQTFAHIMSFFTAKKADGPLKYAKGAIEGLLEVTRKGRHGFVFLFFFP